MKFRSLRITANIVVFTLDVKVRMPTTVSAEFFSMETRKRPRSQYCTLSFLFFSHHGIKKVFSLKRLSIDPARTRTWNPLIRSQMPYPLGHEVLFELNHLSSIQDQSKRSTTFIYLRRNSLCWGSFGTSINKKKSMNLKERNASVMAVINMSMIHRKNTGKIVSSPDHGNHCDFQQISMIFPTWSWTLPCYGSLLKVLREDFDVITHEPG